MAGTWPVVVGADADDDGYKALPRALHRQAFDNHAEQSEIHVKIDFAIAMIAFYYMALASLLIACFVSLYRYRRFTKPFKIITVLLCASATAEILAYICNLWSHSNMIIYGIFSPLELLLVSMYFNYSINVFRKRRIGLIIGAIGIAAGIMNAIFLQPLNGTNQYFLFFEGIATISMALFAFARIMIEEVGQSLTRNPRFWMGIVFVFFWTVTFCNWGLNDYLYVRHPSYSWIVHFSILIANIITYSATAVILLRLPKWASHNE